jgi:Flp pilus assembly protein TadG
MKIRPFLGLGRDSRGAAAVEFAVLVPVLLAMVIGVTQLGVLFFANAGLRNAVNEGARYATIWPQPTDAQIKTKMATGQFGLDARYLSTPTLASGTDAGARYVEITATYDVPLNFVFYKPAAVKLTETRRAYVQGS